MEYTKEMYLRSKYKYLIKSFSNRAKSILTPAEEKSRLKELKRIEMERLCKPGEKARKKQEFTGRDEEEIKNFIITKEGEKKGK